MAIDYEGDSVDIELLSNDCVLYNKQGKFIIVSTITDAKGIIDLLERFIFIQETPNNE